MSRSGRCQMQRERLRNYGRFLRNPATDDATLVVKQSQESLALICKRQAARSTAVQVGERFFEVSFVFVSAHIQCSPEVRTGEQLRLIPSTGPTLDCPRSPS